MTHLVDRRRWSWEAHARALQIRIQTYTEFLTALEDTAQDLLGVLRAENLERRPAAAEDAFASHGLGALRYRIQILAPASVVEAADDAFRQLRRARDYVATADPLDSVGLRAHKDSAGALRDQLKQLMRQDINAG